MSATGGSIENVNVHGRDFSVAADADSNRKLGGFESDVEANGDGTGRKIKTRVPWTLSGISVDIDDSNGDAEYLQAIADDNTFGPITITYASGAVYQGTGTVAGEFVTASMSTTAAIELKGTGKLTKQ
jgi:hypothetical protein